MLRILDDRERELVFLRPPQRIVSLVPSDTLNVIALGAGDRLVGRTRYCDAPQGQVEHLPTVGGTKDVEVEAVAALQPDLVLANQEENARAPVQALIERGIPVLVCFPRTVLAGLSHLARLSRVLGVADAPAVKELLRRGLSAHAQALKAAEGRPRLRTLVPIWMEPLMVANSETFLSDAVALCGGDNVFSERKRRYPLRADLGRAEPSPAGDRDTRYPRVTWDEVVAREPQLVLLPDEPHAFTEADAEQFRALAIPAARSGAVRLCGGRDLMWYGAQSVEGIPRLARLFDELRGGLR